MLIMISRQAAKLIADRDLVAPDSTVIAAVSGGMDSVALLHILLRLRDNVPFRLHVASLDHGIRGADSAADLAFTRELAATWNLPFSGGYADVPQSAKRESIGIEAAARKTRYDFLAGVAEEQGASSVAVAHHALDQAETILLNMIRGAGLRGQRGMRPDSRLPGYPHLRLIRPLLFVSRDAIEAYIAHHKLPFRHDESNDDLRYARNFLRHKTLLPLLEKERGMLEALARLADAAAADEAFIESRFEMEALPQIKIRAGRWTVSIAALGAWHEALQRRCVRAAYESLSGAALSYAATLTCLRFIRNAPTGKRLDLGNGIQLRIDYDELHIESVDAPPLAHDYRLIPVDTDFPLRAPADIRVGDLHLRLTRERLVDAGSSSLQLPARGDLRLRTRQSGDRFCPRGLGGRSQKLKDWMINRKIPRELRSRIPLICLDGAVIAICLGGDWHVSHLVDAAPADDETVTVHLI